MLTIESRQRDAVRPYRVEMYRHCQEGEPALNCRLNLCAGEVGIFQAMMRLRLTEWVDQRPGTIYYRVFKISED